MTELEKVEKLRERADVTYEEAKAALDQAGGDLLDAMVLLERQGKTRKPEKSVYSTSYEDQDNYEKVRDKVNRQGTAPRTGQKLGKLIRRLWTAIRNNSFRVTKEEREIFIMPGAVFVLLLLFAWKYLVPLMILGLFFQFRYSFVGTDELRGANEFMEKAGDVVEDVKREFSE